MSSDISFNVNDLPGALIPALYAALSRQPR